MELTRNSSDDVKKETSEELIRSYYDRALRYAINQNRKLSKLSLDINAPGGYVDTYYTRGISRGDFSTPFKQVITAEEMANDGYFSQILNTFCALCSEVKTELSYNTSSLKEDPLHEKIYDFLNFQINTLGGYETIFERVIKPSLRWGTGIGQTVMRPFKFGGRTLAGIESLKTVNLMNVIRFVFDEKDPSRLRELKFLTFPKAIKRDLSEIFEKTFEKEDSLNADYDITEVLVKTIDIKYNCTAVTAHKAIDGNPLGVPYLYFLYPIWKTYKAMLEGTYNAMISFGAYPLAIKRNSSESGVDALAWENAESDKLEEIIALGGAPYISSEGEMYKLDPPDVEKLLSAQETMYDMATRASGLGQITMGIKGGGSRDLMESIDVLTDKHIKNTVKKALIDVSDTLIKNLVRINFAREYNAGRIVEIPALKIKDIPENGVVSDSLNKNKKVKNKKESQSKKKEASDRNAMSIQNGSEKDGTFKKIIEYFKRLIHLKDI